MAVPTLLTTQARGETVAGVTYHVEGELVPVLSVELKAMPVYFEHHILLWKDPSVDVSLRPLKGAFKRVLSGMPIFMTQAKGPAGVDRIVCKRRAALLEPLHRSRADRPPVHVHPSSDRMTWRCARRGHPPRRPGRPPSERSEDQSVNLKNCAKTLTTPGGASNTPRTISST